jgi:hypothetical protein
MIVFTPDGNGNGWKPPTFNAPALLVSVNRSALQQAAIVVLVVELVDVVLLVVVASVVLVEVVLVDVEVVTPGSVVVVVELVDVEVVVLVDVVLVDVDVPWGIVEDVDVVEDDEDGVVDDVDVVVAPPTPGRQRSVTVSKSTRGSPVDLAMKRIVFFPVRCPSRGRTSTIERGPQTGATAGSIAVGKVMNFDLIDTMSCGVQPGTSVWWRQTVIAKLQTPLRSPSSSHDGSPSVQTTPVGPSRGDDVMPSNSA